MPRPLLVPEEIWVPASASHPFVLPHRCSVKYTHSPTTGDRNPRCLILATEHPARASSCALGMKAALSATFHVKLTACSSTRVCAHLRACGHPPARLWGVPGEGRRTAETWWKKISHPSVFIWIAVDFRQDEEAEAGCCCTCTNRDGEGWWWGPEALEGRSAGARVVPLDSLWHVTAVKKGARWPKHVSRSHYHRLDYRLQIQMLDLLFRLYLNKGQRRKKYIRHSTPELALGLTIAV